MSGYTLIEVLVTMLLAAVATAAISKSVQTIATMAKPLLLDTVEHTVPATCTIEMRTALTVTRCKSRNTESIQSISPQ